MKTLSPKQVEALALARDGRYVPDFVREDDGWHARWRSVDGSENPWLDEIVRAAAMTPLTADAEEDRYETIDDAWIAALRSRSGLVIRDETECAVFAAKIREWNRAALEDRATRKTLEFVFSAAAGGGAIALATPRGRSALRELGLATEVFGPLRGLRAAEGGNRLAVDLTMGEAESFLRTGARALADAGYSVAGVDIAARVTAEAEITEESRGRRGEAKFSAKLKIRVAGEIVSAEEIRFLLEQGSTLVFFRNRWIEVDRAILREALKALEKGASGLSRARALAFARGIGSFGRLEIESASAGGWLRGLVERLSAAGEDALPAKLPLEGTAFRGELRDYQTRGTAWVDFLTANSFGALLADDMGLGKTIETIAWLALDRARETKEKRAPALVVAPLTLIANWRHELAAFAPSFKVYVHQGDNRHFSSGFRRAAMKADVVLTSYTLLVREEIEFAEIDWSALVLDEAQAIKNPDTRAAAAVRSLGVVKRLALTGTPVENSVRDLWSLEEFLNPGFLPDRKSFEDRYAKPLALDPLAAPAKKLRHALEPFILRRLKSDPRVAAELGEKREIREYCSLTPRERGEYEAALADYRGSERVQGDVFALITRLKLVCDGGDRIAEGAKFARLAELLGAIYEAGESALVFTQYAKVGATLKDSLEKHFGRKVQFLHGGLTASAREREIAAFNAGGPKVFILSLKAGGFGLNLVKATHVIHFDRWWNPAVEAQATDRAHRIGQKSTVFVHAFITAGTVEERVDAILERKLASSGNLVTTGEAFLAKMSAAEFEATVALEKEEEGE